MTTPDSLREGLERLVLAGSRFPNDGRPEAVEIRLLRQLLAETAPATGEGGPTVRLHNHPPTEQCLINCWSGHPDTWAIGDVHCFSHAAAPAPIPAEVLDAAVEAAANQLISDFAYAVSITRVHDRWHRENTECDSEDGYELCDECDRRQALYDRSRAALRAALTTGLPGVIAAAKAEWEKPIRELVEEIDSQDRGIAGPHLSRSWVADALRALLDAPADTTVAVVHAYGAAGLLVCGLETGGAISRHDGYAGPRRRSTTVDANVTCPDCIAKTTEPTS